MKKQSSLLHPENSSTTRFDRLNNRLARDIRNTLAQTFADCLAFIANLNLLLDIQPSINH